jgi:predicted nucleic acid-binding protein
LGLTIEETEYEVRKFKRLFTFYDDEPNLFAEWENLVTKHQVLGKNVHDARLVAAMIHHQITHLLTFNAKDFKRFSEIILVDPRSF